VQIRSGARGELAALKMRTVFLLLTLVNVSSACGGGAPLTRSIAASVEKGPGTRLVLAEHAGFAWDELCIFGPYTPDERIDSLTGVQGAAGQAHGIGSNDGINLLMFISDHRIAASIAHPRSQGDFGPDVVGKCYSRSQANFMVRVPPANGRGNIGPE
jgi:hypothetical protein